MKKALIILVAALLCSTVSMAQLKKIGGLKEIKLGNILTSADGKYNLEFMKNGNLVLKEAAKELWSSKTADKGVVKCAIEQASNLVLYDAKNKALWKSDKDAALKQYLPIITQMVVSGKMKE